MLNELKKLSNKQLVNLHRKLNALAKSENSALKDKQHRLKSIINAAKNKQVTNVQAGHTINDLVANNAYGINDIIWPYWFTSQNSVVEMNSQTTGVISITQEAPFVLISMCKSVYNLSNPGLVDAEIAHIDPNNLTNPDAIGLNVNFYDPQSGYTFFDDPIAIDHLGHAEKPYFLESPYMFLPNSKMEINFFNTSVIQDYFTQFTFFGYRIKIENIQNSLGLVTEF